LFLLHFYHLLIYLYAELESTQRAQASAKSTLD